MCAPFRRVRETHSDPIRPHCTPPNRRRSRGIIRFRNGTAAIKRRRLDVDAAAEERRVPLAPRCQDRHGSDEKGRELL